METKTPINNTPWNLIEERSSKDVPAQFELYKCKVKGFTEVNEELNLKKGDVISFFGGYNDDIEMISSILGFDADGHAFVLWECYWYPVDLKAQKRQFKKVEA